MRANMWAHVLRHGEHFRPTPAYDTRGVNVSDLAVYLSEAEAKAEAQRIAGMDGFEPVEVVPVMVTVEID